MAMAGNEDEEEKRWKGQLTADWTDRGCTWMSERAGVNTYNVEWVIIINIYAPRPRS